MSKKVIKRLAMLQRRSDYTRARALIKDCSPAAERFLRAEHAALEWAIGIVRAAIEIGTLDELEIVARGLNDFAQTAGDGNPHPTTTEKEL